MNNKLNEDTNLDNFLIRDEETNLIKGFKYNEEETNNIIKSLLI